MGLFGLVGFFSLSPLGLGPNPVDWAKLTTLQESPDCEVECEKFQISSILKDLNLYYFS